MIRIVLGYLLKAAVVAVPLLLPFFVAFATPANEKAIGAAVSVLMLTAILTLDLVEHAIPRYRAQKVREEYLNELVRGKFKRASSHLRFNVMMARRRWYFLWLLRTFEWTASKNFEPGQHHDARLWLGCWQGVAGKTLQEQTALFVDFRKLPAVTPSRWPWSNPFKLARWQLRRTRNVVAILSVPLLVERGSGGGRRYVPVGVFNVDAVTTQGADWLAAHCEELKKPLMRSGVLMAAFG